MKLNTFYKQGAALALCLIAGLHRPGRMVMVGNTNTRPLRSGVSNRRINVALGWEITGYSL